MILSTAKFIFILTTEDTEHTEKEQGESSINHHPLDALLQLSTLKFSSKPNSRPDSFKGKLIIGLHEPAGYFPQILFPGLDYSSTRKVYPIAAIQVEHPYT